MNFLLFLGLNAKYILILDLILKGTNIRLCNIVLNFQILHLLFWGISKMQQKFQLALWNNLCDDPNFHLILFQQNIFLLHAASTQSDKKLFIGRFKFHEQIFVIIES